MTERSDRPRLAPEPTATLIDFARGFGAATRAVALYPAAHPAIASTLERIAHLTSAELMPRPLCLTVLPDDVLVDGLAPAKSDRSISELAAVLHQHLVGEMTVHPNGDTEAWRSFVLLVGRSSASVRAEGGIARLWTTMGGRHVELKEIDYSQVLRERAGGDAATWEHIVSACLQGQSAGLDEDVLRALVGLADDRERFAAIVNDLDQGALASHSGIPARTAALVRLLEAVSRAVATIAPERSEMTFGAMAAVVGKVPPEVMLELLSLRSAAGGGDPGKHGQLITQVVQRMSDETVSDFVATNVIRDGTATARLAQAFQALVADPGHRPRVLAGVRDRVSSSPLGQAAGFEDLWNSVSEMLTSYSDTPFVSDAYARELSVAQSQAVEVESVADDPPERIRQWMSTIATTAVRDLDLRLLLDLLRVEADPERWGELTRVVVSEIEELALVADFERAHELATILVAETRPDGTPPRSASATSALDALVKGPMLGHIVSHVATVDDVQFGRARGLCLSIGEPMVSPLAEALSVEDRPRARERLTALLIAFGATGRQTVERLKTSTNPAVRRTAVYLLREFGGSSALPDLTALLDDHEPQVQREAVRAILNIGTDAAFRVLQEALAGGTAQSREAILRSIGGVRDERATPLFVYILRHVDHRGALNGIYLRAIDSLGSLRDPDGVAGLKEALYRGEWWAPRRSAALRAAAAGALARIGTAEAITVLREASISGHPGLRTIAKQQLAHVEAGGQGDGR
jgi:hypothetical protein